MAHALDGIAFDAASQPIWADDQPAIMRHSEFAGPHLAGMPVHLNPGDDRDHGTRALRMGDATPHQLVAIAVGVWRRARLLPGALGRRLDDGDIARRLQVAQAGGDRAAGTGVAT